MAKRRARTQIGNLIPDHQKLGIASISLRVGDVWHIIEKFSMKATSFLPTSFQSEVYTQSYGPPKS
jgi:hypothetical protein